MPVLSFPYDSRIVDAAEVSNPLDIVLAGALGGVPAKISGDALKPLMAVDLSLLEARIAALEASASGLNAQVGALFAGLSTFRARSYGSFYFPQDGPITVSPGRGISLDGSEVVFSGADTGLAISSADRWLGGFGVGWWHLVATMENGNFVVRASRSRPSASNLPKYIWICPFYAAAGNIYPFTFKDGVYRGFLGGAASVKTLVIPNAAHATADYTALPYGKGIILNCAVSSVNRFTAANLFSGYYVAESGQYFPGWTFGTAYPPNMFYAPTDDGGILSVSNITAASRTLYAYPMEMHIDGLVSQAGTGL